MNVIYLQIHIHYDEQYLHEMKYHAVKTTLKLVKSQRELQCEGFALTVQTAPGWLE